MLSDAKSTETFVALRFWARSTGYTPTPEESKVLTACEERSSTFWRYGIVGGGASGVALSAALKVAPVQNVAVSTAFASLASLYAQYRANKPCLEDLFELSAHTHSPLAEQAREIVRTGGAATVREVQREVQRRAQLAAGEQRSRSASEVASDSTTSVEGIAAGSRAGSLVAPSGPSPFGPSPFETSAVPAPSPSSQGDSWEAVRQRYRARAEGDSGAAPGQPAAPASSAPAAAWVPAAPMTEGTPMQRRVRRNAYGDEVLD